MTSVVNATVNDNGITLSLTGNIDVGSMPCNVVATATLVGSNNQATPIGTQANVTGATPLSITSGPLPRGNYNIVVTWSGSQSASVSV